MRRSVLATLFFLAVGVVECRDARFFTTPVPETGQSNTGITLIAPVPTLFPTPVQGVLKMKDLYKVGMEAYKAQDYDKAERLLRTAVGYKDKYTPKYFYAEAHAMLGFIYQKWLPVPNHMGLAREHYQEALKIDPNTPIAKRHLPEVKEAEGP